MVRLLKYDEKGRAYDMYSVPNLKKMLRSKDPNKRYTAKKILEWEKKGRTMRKQIEKQKRKRNVFGFSRSEIPSSDMFKRTI